jgi:aryl-alcohol dehydrogenase-like predicted oxidoreductase
MTTRELGRTGIRISPVGLGCMQLSGVSGRGLAASMFEQRTQQHADEIVKAALDGGITWFDSAALRQRGFGAGIESRVGDCGNQTRPGSHRDEMDAIGSHS